MVVYFSGTGNSRMRSMPKMLVPTVVSMSKPVR